MTAPLSPTFAMTETPLPADTGTGLPTAPEEAPTGTATPHDPAPQHWWRWWAEGLRAGFLRPLGALPTSVGPWTMLAVLAVASLFAVLSERATYGDPMVFSSNGWVWSWIHLFFPLGLAWWVFSMTRPGLRHSHPTAAWVLLSQLALLVPMFVVRGWAALGVHHLLPGWALQPWLNWVVYGMTTLWCLLVYWRLAQALHHDTRVRIALPALSVGLLTLQGWTLNTSSWETDYAALPERPRMTLSQSVFLDQEALMAQTLDSVQAAPSPDVRVFGLVYAPYAEDVFQRESDMVAERMARRLDAGGRVVRLLNHPSATSQWPWATPHNLQRAIAALAARMDRDRDVLVIYLTSHGGRDHRLASSHWPLEVDDLTAAELRQWLDTAGIRYRAIAVSACYSGGWIEPLKGPDTLVMTAADAQHTSYGCGNRSELTFFGKAVFAESLDRTLSLEAAFADAVPRIQSREVEAGKDDGFSNPQIAVGDGFRSQWARWMDARSAGAPSGGG